MTDDELIRKAAEAMHRSLRVRLKKDDVVWAVTDKTFSTLSKEDQGPMLEMAEAALKVFYEHTRAQPREQAAVICPDCGHTMTPAKSSLGAWYCTYCAATQSA